MTTRGTRGAQGLVVAALCAGGFSVANAGVTAPSATRIAALDDKPKKILRSPPPPCQPRVKYHAGDVWVEDFYEMPSSRKLAKTDVRYKFRVCWQPMRAEHISDPDVTCSGPNFETPRQLAEQLDLSIGIFHSSKAEPKRFAKAPLPISEFTMSVDEAEGGGVGPLCRSYTTPPVARPKQVHAAWIRAQPAGPWDNEWSFQNLDTENDFKKGRAELTVEPGAYSVVKNTGVFEVTHAFKACNAGDDVTDLELGLNVAHELNTKEVPTTWTSFVEVGTLKARACKTVSHTFNTDSGIFRGFVKVDPKGRTKEVVETNNVVSFDYGAVEVSASTPPGRGSSGRSGNRNRGGSTPPAGRDQDDPPPESPSEGHGGGGKKKKGRGGDSGGGARER